MMKGNRVHQTKILTKTDQDGFSSAAFRSRIEQKKNSRYWMFSLLRLCFVFSGEIYATEWAVFVSVDITFYSFALSYLLDFSFLHHSCRRIFTVFYLTTMKHDRFGRIFIGDTFWPPNRTFNTQKMINLLTVRILAILRLTVNRIMTYWR